MNEKDLQILAKRGISEKQIEEQLLSFKNGFPFLKIEKAAEIGDGILKIENTKEVLSAWDKYLASQKKVVKFVPASGAASRMFKNLFEFLSASYDAPTTDFEKKFFDNITKFAFYDDLNQKCEALSGKNIATLLDEKQYKKIVSVLLDSDGLNYGNLPKGLLKFHTYDGGNRTSLEEHLVEGALYSATNGVVNLHFTVSENHRTLFEEKVKSSLPKYEKAFGVKYNVSFSTQKPSTDTIAADENNQPFREEDGSILFRPGGHGALIENLNDIDADVIFIKNIDNVVPDSFKDKTIEYKKVLAGVLVELQAQVFQCLKLIDEGDIPLTKQKEILTFCEEKLNNKTPKDLRDEDILSYLKGKLNRPIRVCGMVKNEGEPGGGPYLIENSDGSISPQILESSQINTKDKRSLQIMSNATHFNPVDLVCCVKNYKGEKFNLVSYVDKNTGFISKKSKNGRELKALELPGLWNGAMSDWNTVFVEVPIETFNPVKTVNDLLRKEHQ